MLVTESAYVRRQQMPIDHTVKPICRLIGLALGFCLLLAQPTYADTVTWVDWTSATSTSATGTVAGVTINFSGNINPAAQTSGGTNFWATNPSTYTSPPTVDNSPPDSDIIRLTGGTSTGTQTLTFSQPVVNPVMAILSLGQPGAPVQYNFDAGFTILNNGPGFFGNGALTALPGNILQGQEGHGIIQFNGTFSSISWTIPTAEFWHGFQVGIHEVAGPNPVPEPTTMLLLGTGLAGVGAAVRKRRKVEKENP